MYLIELGGEHSPRLLLGGLLADLSAEHYTWVAGGDKRNPDSPDAPESQLFATRCRILRLVASRQNCNSQNNMKNQQKNATYTLAHLTPPEVQISATSCKKLQLWMSICTSRKLSCKSKLHLATQLFQVVLCKSATCTLKLHLNKKTE